MNKTKYLFNAGRMSRRDNTLKFTPTDANGVKGKSVYLPIEQVSTLYCFGSVDVNSALLTFMGQKQISMHFFDYYEHYRGSFMPKEHLLAGKMVVQQVNTYTTKNKRLYLAQTLLKGAMFNMLQNLKYYNRRTSNFDLEIEGIEEFRAKLCLTGTISELMGLEGNARMKYYACFDEILKKSDFEMRGRSRQPPKNEVNALISFGNMMCYTLCLDAIRHTQLNPTISFLHEPGVRRYSLALDLAEIFKPVLVDKVIFRLINRGQLQKGRHFDDALNGCFLNDAGKKVFIKAFETRLKDTIKHDNLKRQVSYRHLVRLECYKLANYMMGISEDYQPYKS